MNKYFLPLYHSELKPWIKWWILKRLNGGESTLKAVTISSGTLTKVDKSKALSIKEYYGNTVQDGTPTPDSPIPVQTISGDNTFTINGNSYRVDLGGKNLCSMDNTNPNLCFTVSNNNATRTIEGTLLTITPNTSITAVNKGVYWKLNTTYYQGLIANKNTTISFDLKAEGNCTISVLVESSGQGNIYNTFNATTEWKRYSVTFNRNLQNWTAISFYETDNTDKVFYIRNVMVALDSFYTYSPYVSNPIELCKIGNYKDKIVNDNGTWKVEKNIGKIVLNGIENWSKRTDISTITTSCFRTDYSSEVSANMVNGTIVLSNMFTCLNNTNDVEHFRYIGAVNYRLQLFINKSRLSSDDTTGLKTWLSNNNTTVYYQLANTTTETITNTNLISQLNALYEFYVNSSSVNVSNNSQIPLEVLLEYYGR